MLTVGSLFSGIGGMDLGLERAGMRVRWQVERDDWCRRVLAKHWPDVQRFNDVLDVGAQNLSHVDVIAGGFPCQDISQAGRGEGIRGSRSGLWFEFARVVHELRPRYVLVENVPLLRSRGMGVVVSGLAESGYDVEWDCIPAAAIGAPHLRDRLWLIAYRKADAPRPDADGSGSHRAPADPTGQEREVQPGNEQGRIAGPLGEVVAHPDGCRLAQYPECDGQPHPRFFGSLGNDAQRHRLRSAWAVEPGVGRVADGVPARVDRLTGLGNAAVPQLVEAIGRWIVEAEAVEEVARMNAATAQLVELSRNYNAARTVTNGCALKIGNLDSGAGR